MKKIFVLFLTIFFSVTSVSALDLVFNVEPAISFPSQKNYSTAFGGTVQADVDLMNFMTAGVEGGFIYEKPVKCDGNLNTLYGGINLGFYYYPLSRLYVGLGGSFGVDSYISSITKDSSSSSDSNNFADLYYRGYGEIGFRLNPSLSLNAVGGYQSFLCSGSPAVLSGPFAGISLRITASVGANAKKSAIDIKVVQESDVFPVFSTVYANEPFGSIVIQNDEGAELRDVHVSFRAGKYTTELKECGSVARINRHSSVEIPLYANFSSDILNFTENGKISAEIVVDYEFLGKKMSTVEPVIISVYNRNAFIWSDAASLAAFISPDSQELSAFAKEIIGITRANLYTGMNANLQYAIGIIEGLKLAGINYSGDTVTPFVDYYSTYDLDSIQYPLQTLQYLSGDYDDLGILVCSCLQIVDVPTGYIATPDDFLVLVKLNMSPSQVLNNFESDEGLLLDKEADEVYMALSMKNLEKGFTKSFEAGREAIVRCFEDEENYYEFVDTVDAWTVYKPATYSNGSFVDTPKQEELLKNINAAINQYISSDINVVIDRARTSGDANRLGVALIRAGRFTEAKSAFTKAANAGSVSAMNNVANILMIEKNYTAAAAQYRKVLEKSPNNSIAIKGLENATSKIE